MTPRIPRDLRANGFHLKNAFSYDDRKGFSDLKIFTIQNNYRFSEMNDKYGLPFQSGFCADFSMDNKRNRLIQRYLCPEKCFWNPQVRFWTKVIQGILLI